VPIAAKVYFCGPVPGVEKGENQARFGESRVGNIRVSQPSKHYTAAQRK
jgi:hypothetical protein